MSAHLTVKCLGGLHIELGGITLSNFETDKARALLLYLVNESRWGLRRSHVAGMLWPDEREERALHNLRQTLSSLRKTLGENKDTPEFILADRETIQIHPQAEIFVDCLEFQQQLEKTFIHYQGHNGSGLFHPRFLQRSMEIFQGEFLANFSISKSVLFDEWLILKREEYNRMAIRGYTLLSIYYEKRSEYKLAIENISKIVDLCPWDENSRNRMIRLLGVDYQWTSAKNRYFDLKRYLEVELSAVPSSDSNKLFEQICLASDGKSTITPEYKPEHYQIPFTHSNFIGRERELDEVVSWLISPKGRLITITGLGGIGKTRFAIEIAKQFVGLFKHGVFFVPLVSASNCDQMITLIAKSIGIEFSEQAPNQKQLIDYLRGKNLLLILDNFDYLLSDEQCVDLLDLLLNEITHLKVVVTSREVLNLVQEQVYLLPGLEFPPDTSLSLSEIQSYDAITLFINRTLQKMPQFVINQENVKSIIRICSILEGLPLGVELAAATLCEQGLDQISESIESRLSILETRMSNFHKRHRSLNAAFEISWDLLSAKLKKVAFGLSYFLDGFTAEAANKVTGATSSDLTMLISKSLLRIDENSRYSIHEAIRQFISTKRIQDIEIQNLQEKHAEYYSNQLFVKNTELLNNEQADALNSIQIEFGNLTLCWNWILAHCRIDLIVKCMDSLYHYFSICSLFDEGISWFKHAVSILDQQCHDELVSGMMLWRLGALAFTGRDDELMLECLNRAEKTLEQNSALVELAYCRIHLGWAYQRQKNFLQAKRYAELAMEYFRKVDNELGLTQAYVLTGSIENRQGNYHLSRPYFEEAYHLCSKTRNPRNLLIVINRLADISSYEGNYDNAINLFEQSLEISRQINDRYNQAILLNNLGTIYHLQHDFERALSYYEQSLLITRDIGDRDGTALALNNLGELASWKNEFDRALSYSEEALAIAQEINENWTVIVCLNSLGEIYIGMDKLEKSKEYFVRALKLAVEINGLDLVARVMVNLARVYQLKGDRELAFNLLIAGLCHSATEQDSRDKATAWLQEMHYTFDNQINDNLMNELISGDYLSNFP